MSSYYATEIYIGTQSNENNEIFYKSLKDYLDNNNSTKQTIEIEKSKYLYIVDAKYDKTTVSKFQIPETVNEAILEYNPYLNTEIKLNGYIDSKLNQFVVSDGKLPLLFHFEKLDSNLEKISSDFLAIEYKTDNDFLKNNGFVNLQNNITEPTPYVAPYTFKYKLETSLSNAINNTKKTPNKFLVVVFDNKNKNIKSSFDNFIKTSEESMSSYMYNEYNAQYDNFNYYLASSKDKGLLNKNNINSNQEIIVLNSDGEMVYHTNGTIDEKKDFFYIYNSIYNDLKAAKEELELDNVINNKNATINEIKTIFRKTLSSDFVYMSAAPAIIDAEQIHIDPPKISEDNYPPPPLAVEEKISYENTLDTTAVVESKYDYSYYDKIKDRNNLYHFKSSKEAVLNKWKKLLYYFKSTKIYDKEFVQILKAELSNKGFTQKLFAKTNFNSSDLDFEQLDYVFANYQLLLNPPVEKISETAKQDEPAVITEYESYYYEEDIKTTINSYFSFSNFTNNPQIDKVLKYFKNYLQISGFEDSTVKKYLEALKVNINNGNNKKEYLETYENYFNSIMKDNYSVIENLDNSYTSRALDDYSYWTTYKNSFAELANEVCWYHVENSNDIAIIKKAIKWSETSLIIEKNNHYYLDTLAQLYYKNGEKQKAILTEQKAIDGNQGEESTEVYKKVLEKMKNGTY